MFNETGVNLQRVATIEEEATFSVSLDGHVLGNVTFATYYEPVLKAIDTYIAVWSGPILCIIDRQRQAMRCVDREDETHRVHPFGNMWIIEGELRIDLFEPLTSTTVASYAHDEVILDSWVDGELICIRDFQNRKICLDPRENLRRVAAPS